MNNIKMWLTCIAVIAISLMAITIQSQFNKLRIIQKELTETKQKLNLEQRESKLKLSAFEKREQELIKDRKELENEYNEFTKTQQNCEVYNAWGNVRLPASVSSFLRNQQ